MIVWRVLLRVLRNTRCSTTFNTVRQGKFGNDTFWICIRNLMIFSYEFQVYPDCFNPTKIRVQRRPTYLILLECLRVLFSTEITNIYYFYRGYFTRASATWCGSMRFTVVRAWFSSLFIKQTSVDGNYWYFISIYEQYEYLRYVLRSPRTRAFSHIHAGVYFRINQVHKVSREDEHYNVCNLYLCK